MIDQRILVNLDTLLDTRLGAISRHSAPAATAVMRNGYWSRENDDFEKMSGGLITNARFKEIYDNRDQAVLKASYLTNIHHLLLGITKALQHKKAAGVEVGTIRLTVNVWPYKFTAEECEVLVESLRGFVAVTTEIDTAYISLADQTPGRLNNDYDAAIIYDYDEWDILHRKEMDESPIPLFTMMMAAKLRNGCSLSDEVYQTEDGVVDPWKALTHYMTGRIALAIEPLFFFSITRPSS